MRPELENVRMMIKTCDEWLIYLLEHDLKRIYSSENLEVEVTRVNKRPGFGRFFAYFHLHIPEGGS